MSTVTEVELAAKAVGPRVTPEDIEAAIASQHYFTADDGVYGREVLIGDSVSTPEPRGPLGMVTICVLVLRNGTKIVGVNTGPVSSVNFDADVGRRYAREHAVDQVWPLLGYELRSRLAAK